MGGRAGSFAAGKLCQLEAWKGAAQRLPLSFEPIESRLSRREYYRWHSASEVPGRISITALLHSRGIAICRQSARTVADAY